MQRTPPPRRSADILPFGPVDYPAGPRFVRPIDLSMAARNMGEPKEMVDLYSSFADDSECTEDMLGHELAPGQAIAMWLFSGRNLVVLAIGALGYFVVRAVLS